jgi:hypothetical protein
MIAKIIKSVREELENKLIILGVSPSKTKSTVDLAHDVVFDAISIKASIPELVELFLSGNPFDQNSLMTTITSEYKEKMMSKLSLDEPTARSASRFMIQFIMARLGNEVSRQERGLELLKKDNRTYGKLKNFGGNLLKTLVL